jgi:hypothetical protein
VRVGRRLRSLASLLELLGIEQVSCSSCRPFVRDQRYLVDHRNRDFVEADRNAPRIRILELNTGDPREDVDSIRLVPELNNEVWFGEVRDGQPETCLFRSPRKSLKSRDSCTTGVYL